MRCPFTFSMLETLRANGFFAPMDRRDYMAFAGASDGSVIMYGADEWTVVYGTNVDDPEGTEPSYYVSWLDYVDGDREPLPERTWLVTEADGDQEI